MKHYTPTRRKKTLRRFVTLFLLLILIAFCGYGFTPTAAVRNLSERWLLDDLRVVATLPLQYQENHLQLPMLADNGHELLYFTAGFTLRSGWQWDDAKPIMLNTESSVNGGVSNHKSGDSRLFGKLYDENIVRWELEAAPQPHGSNNIVFDPIPLPINGEQWFEVENARYFVFDIDMAELTRSVDEDAWFCDATMRCYDSEGELIGETSLGAVTLAWDENA